MRRVLIGDDRGLAMTEGVIVVPFFIIVWAGLAALFHLYEARLTAQVNAGAVAMEMAASGVCGEADMGIDDVDELGGFDTGMGAEEADIISKIAGCQPFAWSHAEASVSVSSSGVPDSMGGDSEMTGARVLMCNMKPVDGLMDLVVEVISAVLGLDDD